MADPFSVAGSAVGVLSLAITTCQGVISYYNSWNTQDQNISIAKGEIERLRNCLSALEEILPKISSSSAIAVHVEQCVLSCQEGTVRLEQFLKKCRNSPAPLSLKDKIRDCGQKAVFPFRQSSLNTLKEIVRNLEGSLGTALQVLHLDTSEAQSRRTSDLVDLTKSTAELVVGANQGISNVERKVDMVVGGLPQIQRGVAQVMSDVPFLQSSFTSMEQRLQAMESLTSQILPGFQTKLDQLPLRIRESLAESTTLARLRPSAETPNSTVVKSVVSTTLTDMTEDAQKLQLALARRPSLLRSVCDRAGGLEMIIEPVSPITAHNKITQEIRKGKWTKQRSYCCCSTLTRERTATYSIGSLKIFKTSVEFFKHSTTCPFYIGTEATTTVGLKMSYYGRLLANTVRATMSFTAGAGGFSVSPCLKLSAVVSRGSPAFRLLDERELRRRIHRTPQSQTNEVGEYLESALQQLYELFKDRAASPTDIDEDGNTLLTTLCWCARDISEYNIETLQSFRILLLGLVAAGAPLNETDRFGGSALDRLARAAVADVETRCGQKIAEIAMEMSEAGAELSESWYRDRGYYTSPTSSVRELEWMTKYDEWIDDCKCGALSAAILCRSENDIQQILRNSPQSIHEQNLRWQSPLHLSCNWPKGIILLLHHGGKALIDRPDRNGFLPLAYSCASNCLEGVKLILEADSALYSPVADGWYYDRSIYEEAIRTSTDEIISHLETALVDRRRRLYSLATTKLCCKDLGELELTEDRILDERAFDVYEALRHRNVPIPSALRIPTTRTTLFHNEQLSPALGESLYGRGFTDVNGVDSRGLTPLMCMDYFNVRLEHSLQRVLWLISKGADPGRNPEKREGWDPNTTAAHYICSLVGQNLFWRSGFEPKGVSPDISHTWSFGILDQLGDDCQSLVGELFSSEVYDRCLCACSSLGCTPGTTTLKSVTQLYDYMSHVDKQSIPHPIEGHLWVIKWIETLLGHRHEAWRWLSREIIRYETFEKLELTHTCYKIDIWSSGVPYRNDDVDCEEIREEEHFLISKLDALVAEFKEKYIELGVPVSEFLKGYWKARMEEVEREEEPLDDEEIAKIRDLGVVIHS